MQNVLQVLISCLTVFKIIRVPRFVSSGPVISQAAMSILILELKLQAP